MLDLIVQEIERQGWSYTTGLLPLEELKKINHYFDSLKDQFSPAKIGPENNKKRVEAVRGDYTLWIDVHEPPECLRGAMSFLNELVIASNYNLYLGLKQFECHFSCYPAGSFYIKHSDRFEGNTSRALSFVFYTHEKWNAGDGGELIIYGKDDSIIKVVDPIPGSFICFLSEEFPHEVKSGKLERRSLTGWMHTKIIY